MSILSNGVVASGVTLIRISGFKIQNVEFEWVKESVDRVGRLFI